MSASAFYRRHDVLLMSIWGLKWWPHNHRDSKRRQWRFRHSFHPSKWHNPTEWMQACTISSIEAIAIELSNEKMQGHIAMIGIYSPLKQPVLVILSTLAQLTQIRPHWFWESSTGPEWFGGLQNYPTGHWAVPDKLHGSTDCCYQGGDDSQLQTRPYLDIHRSPLRCRSGILRFLWPQFTPCLHQYYGESSLPSNACLMRLSCKWEWGKDSSSMSLLQDHLFSDSKHYIWYFFPLCANCILPAGSGHYKSHLLMKRHRSGSSPIQVPKKHRLDIVDSWPATADSYSLL